MSRLDTALLERVTGLRSFEMGGRSWVALLVKDAHVVLGRPKPTPARATKLFAERQWTGDLLVEESDNAAAARPGCDVVLSGSAYNPHGTAYVDTRLEVAGLGRRVRVWGARRFVVSSSEVGLTRAEPFESATLSRQRAYGGPLSRRRPRGAFGANQRTGEVGPASTYYPRNTEGCGFTDLAHAAELHGTLAPSQEDPEDPVTGERVLLSSADDWWQAPLAADYGPLDVTEFPRSQWVLPLKVPRGDALIEVRRGWLPQTPPVTTPGQPHPASAHAAAPGLLGPVAAGDDVRAENVFPGGGEVHLRVPSGPRAARARFVGGGKYDASFALRTVHLRPDEGLLECTWVARFEVAMPFPEASLAQVATEVRE
jgi:hypothetical protein